MTTTDPLLRDLLVAPVDIDAAMTWACGICAVADQYPPEFPSQECANKLAAALMALQPVWVAAKEWHAAIDFKSSRNLGEIFTCELDLLGAIDKALSPASARGGA